jgi:hypothetical protein
MGPLISSEGPRALEVVVDSAAEAPGARRQATRNAARPSAAPFQPWRPHPPLEALRAWLLSPSFQLAVQLAAGTGILSCFIFIWCADVPSRGRPRLPAVLWPFIRRPRPGWQPSPMHDRKHAAADSRRLSGCCSVSPRGPTTRPTLMPHAIPPSRHKGAALSGRLLRLHHLPSHHVR